jgi:amphi-Trp domain-containing protein
MYSEQLGRRTARRARRNGEAMSDVKVQQKQTLSREEAARFIAALAEGLSEEGSVIVRLGSSTLELSVASQVECELEVAVDGDEIELELELKWSTSSRASAEAAEDGSEDGGSEEDLSAEGGPEEDNSEEAASEQDAGAEDVSEDGASDEEDAGSGDAEPVPAAAPDRSAEPRRGRRNPAAVAGKPAFNGVDTAAVRAWAAANGLTVSPRGRIKEEVLQAYRAAGN